MLNMYSMLYYPYLSEQAISALDAGNIDKCGLRVETLMTQSLDGEQKVVSECDKGELGR